MSTAFAGRLGWSCRTSCAGPLGSLLPPSTAPVAGLSAFLASQPCLLTVPFVSSTFEVRGPSALAGDLALPLVVHRSEASAAGAHVFTSLAQALSTRMLLKRQPHLSGGPAGRRALRAEESVPINRQLPTGNSRSADDERRTLLSHGSAGRACARPSGSILRRLGSVRRSLERHRNAHARQRSRATGWLRTSHTQTHQYLNGTALWNSRPFSAMDRNRIPPL